MSLIFFTLLLSAFSRMIPFESLEMKGDRLPEDVVITNYGAIRGLLFPGFRQFQGVPFATPPLGSLRYRVCLLTELTKFLIFYPILIFFFF